MLVCMSLSTAAVRAQNLVPSKIPNGLPEWAYNIPDKVQPPEPRVPATVRAAGSSKEYEAAAIAGNANPPDWFPDEHPPAPRSVKGPMPNACGSCHLMSGQGHPESADLAGMPPEYIIRQMTYFKSGARSEETRMGPIARAVSNEDVREAAAYFAAITPTPFVKVIEAATAPKTYVSADARHRRIHPDGGTEPIGRRIIQIPEDPMRTTIRDPHS
jgi:cytochrome c553